VRATLYARPQNWPRSTARSHLEGRAGGLSERRRLFDLVAESAGFLT
jgi:hypothetical protein